MRRIMEAAAAVGAAYAASGGMPARADLSSQALRTLSKTRRKRHVWIAALLATAALCADRPAMAGVVPFTWDPAGASPPLAGPGSAFTADTIIHEEFLRGVGQPDGSFMAPRILPITGFSLNGKAVTPAGFGSSYGLYIDIVDTGVDHLPVSITFKSSNFILKADPGNHNGAVSATPGGLGFANQGPTATADDTTLATGSLVSETAGLTAPIVQTFTPAAGQEGFFVSPALNGSDFLESVNTSFGKLVVRPNLTGQRSQPSMATASVHRNLWSRSPLP